MPRLLFALLAAAVLTMTSTRTPVRANGVPIRISLGYLPNLSNWGPQDAGGNAELSFSEASLKIDAHGLLPLKGETYQVWIAKSGTNRAAAVATLPGTPDGLTGYTGKLPVLEGYDWDLLLVTVEPQPDEDPAPSAKRFIGGFFTQYKRQDATGGIDSDTRPGLLPKTGEALPAASTKSDDRHKTAMLLFGVGGISLFLAMRRAARRRREGSG